MIRVRERESGGLGSKGRIAQGAWPLPRFAPKTRSHTRSKSSGPIRSTPFSSWRVTTFRESAPASCKHSCCCALSRRGWVPEDQVPGYRRKTTTHRELVAISVLESRIWRKIEGIVWKPVQSGMPVQPRDGPLFSRGRRHIVASIDNLFGDTLGSVAHRVGCRGGEEHLKFANRALRACQKLRGQSAAVLQIRWIFQRNDLFERGKQLSKFVDRFAIAEGPPAEIGSQQRELSG